MLAVPARFYTPQELLGAEGDFTVSEFVRGVTGVDCVCERAAVLASGNGPLIVKKHAENGVTVALSAENWEVRF